MLEHADVADYVAGQVFVRAGEMHGMLFVVQKGVIQVVVTHQGQEVIIAECREGEILGEMSMLDRKGASTTLAAKTDVKVARIDQASIERLIQSDPEFGVRLYQSLATILAGRLRRLNMQALPFESYG